MSERTGEATSGGQPIRVLLVDDDQLVCAGLDLMLSSAPDLTVVGAVHDGVDVVEAIQRHHPDVVLLDVRMPQQDGITTTRQVRALRDAPAIIVLTTFDHDDVVIRALEAGAAGFLLKTSAPAQIIEAIRDVHSGTGALSPASAAHVIRHVHDGRSDAVREAQAAMARLSEKELEVALLVARGESNAEIARALYVSESTVKTHLTAAQQRLGLRNRTELAVLVTRASL